MLGDVKENNIIESFEIGYPVILEVKDEDKAE